MMKSPEKVAQHIIKWLSTYVENAGINGFVIGISGGIDSAVTSTLCAKTKKKVLCIEMPIKQESGQASRARNHIKWLEANFEPLDFLIRLAEEYSVVVMPGSGFDAPTWSLRVSLANLNDDDYETIMDSTNSLLAQYHEQYLTVIGQ